MYNNKYDKTYSVERDKLENNIPQFTYAGVRMWTNDAVAGKIAPLLAF